MHTPPLTVPTPDASFTPSACTSFDVIGRGTPVFRIKLTGGGIFDLVERPGSSNGTRLWTLYGTVADCYRVFGDLEMKWPEVDLLGAIALPAPASPVLVVRTRRESKGGDRITLYRLTDQGIGEIDHYLQCQWLNPDRLPPSAQRSLGCQYPDACQRFRLF